MRPIPSMLNAALSQVAAFRARLRGSYRVPPDTPPDKAELAFDGAGRQDHRVSEFSGPEGTRPAVQGGAVQVMRSGRLLCGSRAWAAKLIYTDGVGYVSGGLCCAHRNGGCDWSVVGDCAHPMVPV
jgi:hypothetical protein